MPTKHAEPDATAYVRVLLAMGRPPDGRIRGWVGTLATGAHDNVSLDELVGRHGPGLRAECERAGFVPHFDQPIAKQSPAARQAAAHWAQRVVAEGTY